MEIPEAPNGDSHVNGDPLDNTDQKTTNTPTEENSSGDDSSFSDPKNPEETKNTGEEETIGGMRRQLGELGGAMQRALLSDNPKEAILQFVESDKNIRKSFEKSFGPLEEFKKTQKLTPKQSDDAGNELTQEEGKKVSSADEALALANAVNQRLDNAELTVKVNSKAEELNLNSAQAHEMKSFALKVTSGDSSIPLDTAMETWRILHLGVPQTSKTVPVPNTHSPEPKGKDDALNSEEFAKKHGLRRVP